MINPKTEYLLSGFFAELDFNYRITYDLSTDPMLATARLTIVHYPDNTQDTFIDSKEYKSDLVDSETMKDILAGKILKQIIKERFTHRLAPLNGFKETKKSLTNNKHGKSRINTGTKARKTELQPNGGCTGCGN